ncbi:Piso0_000650 [Millerozyma farinosa CBS 7064]|uniref:Piso0_000650 protein n=1 Tax=Pichia sorbitophila (strain ATCC MYA-4447 / BCRC 22081 / CBS 7064 / NBRC 10061 / NRRL Y-12695) TaxID=559304 RepID=G8YR50_PICSO|nr:Piso0_000650 [Millerozyma farinosa CBS 7064]
MNLSGLNEASASLRVGISGLMGSTSLACWIVLLLPQLIEQWRLKSAEGIAIGFISIWFLGDITNLVGALWARLLPEVVFLAVWFCIADFMMIGSYFYYTRIYKKTKDHIHHHSSAAEDETSHLLQRRQSGASTHSVGESNKIFTNYILPILFVLGSGFLGFVLSGSEEPEDPTSHPIEVGPQIMGYISAALYLGARIPQIIQNHRRKSVYGLSLLFFLFSVLGNLTYAGQILFYSSDSQYILLNLSWLLGSLGTIFEDSFIFLQFYMYKDNGKVISD